MTSRLWITTSMVAVAAALVECVGADRPWACADLADAAVRNLVVAVAVLTVVHLAGTRSRPRAHAAAATTDPSPRIDVGRGAPGVDDTPPVPPTDHWVGLVRREIDELATLADHLYGMIALAGYEPELTEETFVRIDDLRWLLGNYVIRGGRVRRLAELPELLQSTTTLDGADGACPQAVGTVRSRAAELLQRIQETNAATVDWLLAHRVALPDPDFLDSNALLGRYHRLDATSTLISGDPLYLLTCHIHDVLETVESLGDVDHPVLEVLETQLAGLLATVEEEITAAQAFNSALLALGGEMRPADAA